ncbi:hypothetical protein CPB84DRAFT_1962595 [Gymnopilus junonius]|uniref:Uncharacterized protein n=1 Tax=Gymnopilus junonius TaxID=109634 RepID=A0A9P5NP64_GYMJU|nr:hypothetical protein CPB84DRAFT_1962595 [Gymnopilus junonius]
MLDVLFLALPVPIVGTVVRYRATYHKKDGRFGPTVDTLPIAIPQSTGVITSAATSVEPEASGCDGLHVNEDIKEANFQNFSDNVDVLRTPSPTFLSVFKKVWKEEKLEGLFKGIFPGLFSILFFRRAYVSPAPLSFSDNYYTILPCNLFYLLFMVTTYRIITTHRKILYSAPKEMLRLLFSEYERHHPFKSLYQSGLVLPYLAQIFFDMFIIQILYSKLGSVGPLLNHYDNEEWWKVFHHPVWNEWAKVAAYWLIAIVSVAFLAPMDVIVTRLAIRPLHDNSDSVKSRHSEKLSDAGDFAPPSYLR